MNIPFVFVYILTNLGVAYIIYNVGNMILDWWDRRKYKEAEKKAAEWLGSWGA